MVLLKRIYDNGKSTLGTFSYISNGEVISLLSLELPWKNNAQKISCIPEGEYDVKLTYSPAFKKNLWLVKNVPNRSGIRIHPANYYQQLQGCIALGLTAYDLDKDGTLDITRSEKALEQAMRDLGNSFKLKITY